MSLKDPQELPKAFECCQGLSRALKGSQSKAFEKPSGAPTALPWSPQGPSKAIEGSQRPSKAPKVLEGARGPARALKRSKGPQGPSRAFKGLQRLSRLWRALEGLREPSRALKGSQRLSGLWVCQLGLRMGFSWFWSSSWSLIEVLVSH